MKVLIVDDSATMRKILARVLRQAELPIEEIVEANNGREALERVQQDGDIDLLLLDLYMPEMNGLDLLRTLRTTHAATQLPVVIVTSETAAAVAELARELGANAYLTKPFTAEQVRAAVEACAT